MLVGQHAQGPQDPEGLVYTLVLEWSRECSSDSMPSSLGARGGYSTPCKVVLVPLIAQHRNTTANINKNHKRDPLLWLALHPTTVVPLIARHDGCHQKRDPRSSRHAAAGGNCASSSMFFFRRRRLAMEWNKCAPRPRLDSSPSSGDGSNDNAAAFTQYLQNRSTATKQSTKREVKNTACLEEIVITWW